jgi:hypothetical protein
LALFVVLPDSNRKVSLAKDGYMPTLFTLPKRTLFSIRLPRIGVRRGIYLFLLIFGILLGSEVIRVLIGNNTHWVIPNRVLRTAQLSKESTERVVREEGIRTIVNLRGCSYPAEWYLTEIESTHQLGISQEDITLSAYRLPAPQELLRLLEVLDRSEYPILIHCRRGSDRTGLVAALVQLLQTDADLATAREQCSVRYGHFRAMKAARIDEFFDQYEEWLQSTNQKHSQKILRHWIKEEYCPGPGRAKLELINPPASFSKNQAISMKLRVHNQSKQAWEMYPGTFAGIHARVLIIDEQKKIIVHDRIGQFRATIPPGEYVDLTIGAPPLRKSGTYDLVVDMIAEGQIAFVQLGSYGLYSTIKITD